MLRVERILQSLPQARTRSQQSSITSSGATANNYRTNAIVTIPVVVHIVLPNPEFVTDANVQFQIDKLNLDFSGFNPDSNNIPNEFKPLRGHSQIRFTLARRTPSGVLTNGINRVRSNTGSDVTQIIDPIKRTSLGGADAFDPNSYLNIWVGLDASRQDILGYAQFPSSGSLVDDGLVINVIAFGNNPCYTDPAYNLGRTTVHETGHYLGLLHTWGDDGGTCTGDDFRSLSKVGSTCNLPTGLFNPDGQGNTPSDIGDTPNQAMETTNCPSGVLTAVSYTHLTLPTICSV